MPVSDQPTDVIEITAEQAGVRLDKLIAGLPRVASRARAREMLASGKVHVDGARVGFEEAGRPLPVGSRVEVRWNQPGTGRDQVRAREAIAEAKLGILYEDDDVLCVDKPPGLLTDAATEEQRRERDTVVQRLTRYLKPQGVSPKVGHRIDRDTSGVVVVAKSEWAWDRLRAQFHARTPERVYWAIVQGVPRPSEGLWADDMVWDSELLVQRPATPSDHNPFHASAHYKVTAVFADRMAQVEVRLVSGRRNQIRLHAMLRGYPLLGERLYTGPNFVHRGPVMERHALHAHRLGFDHPRTGKRLLIESPLPADLVATLKRLGPPIG